MDPKYLFNLSSGEPVPNDLATNILNIHNEGLVSFHHAISRNKTFTFSKTKQKVVIKNKNNVKIVEVNHNFLATLLCYNMETGKAINFANALKYPLSSVPLSIGNADDTKRKTNKSTLQKIILKHSSNNVVPEIVRENTAYNVDLMATIRTMKEIPETSEDLAWQLIKLLPSGYKRVDIVADTYQENSINSMERKDRGNASKILVKSAKSKIPADFASFLSNNDNKAKMIKLIFETIIKEKLTFLNILRTTEVYLSSYNKCILITLSTTTDVNDVCSNQKEADTKIVIHALHWLHHSQIPTINILSPSGDNDILVLTIVHLYNYKEKIHLETGVNRNNIWLGALQFKDEILNALIDFHSFTGNDYVSSFFRKGK